MITKVSAETMARVAEERLRGRQWRFVIRDAGHIPKPRLKRYLRLYDKFGADYFPKEEHMNSSDQYNIELRRMVEKHYLTRNEIASLINAPLETVRNWLRDPSAKGYRKMPSYALELLKIKVDLELEEMRPDTD